MGPLEQRGMERRGNVGHMKGTERLKAILLADPSLPWASLLEFGTLESRTRGGQAWKVSLPPGSNSSPASSLDSVLGLCLATEVPEIHPAGAWALTKTS